MAVPGSGYLIANDILTDISYVLVEPVVNTTLGTPVVAPGVATIFPPTTVSMYPGAMVIVGTGTKQEVVTISAVTPTTITATFAFTHPGTDLVVGATFPVCQTIDPFYSQAEMLNYLSNAENDYLVRVPMILNVVTQNFTPTQKIQSVPSDTLQIERVAYGGFALYEQGQISHDQLNYAWTQEAGQPPRSWFEDRTGFMQYGVEPVPLNAFSVELMYARRDSTVLALNEGFYVPDPFLHHVKYGTLAQIFSKDGEQRDPSRAQYCQQRFDLGVQIANKIFDNILAPTTVSASA